MSLSAEKKYWVFDLDGTLVYSFGHYFTILEELIGEKITAENKKIYIGMNPSQIFDEKLPPEKSKLAMSHLRSKGMNDALYITSYKAIHNAISALKQKGSQIAVWTNRDFNSAELILKSTNLSDCVSHLVSGECVTQKKPHPQGLQIISKHFNCEPQEMIMVGDHDHDMIAALEFGASGVRASWHNYWSDGVCSRAHRQFYKHEDFYNWATTSR
jgi:phosphoglycolate phosphatase-like HAD superfamily hydrolase